MLHDLYSRMVETWRPVPGFEDVYSVSDYGRVRREKASRGTWPGRILSGVIHSRGYLTVSLSPSQRLYIHRLVAEAFLGPCPKNQEVNHKNGNKADNQIRNLEYVTHLENMRHGYENGFFPRGEQRPFSKLTEDDVRQIRALHKQGIMQKDIAPQFNVNKQTICKIVNRQKWKHIS